MFVGDKFEFCYNTVIAGRDLFRIIYELNQSQICSIYIVIMTASLISISNIKCV